MSIQEILACGSGCALLLATLVQIAPVKINPWSWLAKCIGKAINGEVLERLDKVEKGLKDLAATDEMRDIVNSRIRILRFGDECQEGRLHSKEYFDQTMKDITKYEHYCMEHPEFENDITVETAQYIKTLYRELLRNNRFSVQK